LASVTNLDSFEGHQGEAVEVLENQLKVSSSGFPAFVRAGQRVRVEEQRQAVRGAHAAGASVIKLSLAKTKCGRSLQDGGKLPLIFQDIFLKSYNPCGTRSHDS
jgi:hypothetical protein